MEGIYQLHPAAVAMPSQLTDIMAFGCMPTLGNIAVNDAVRGSDAHHRKG